MSDKERAELLIAYLQALCGASQANVRVFEEIHRTITEIEQILA
ncbi:hypothetical protein MKZ02_21070 [Pseudobacillus sp. FSL P4-0506]